MPTIFRSAPTNLRTVIFVLLVSTNIASKLNRSAPTAQNGGLTITLQAIIEKARGEFVAFAESGLRQELVFVNDGSHGNFSVGCTVV